MKDGWDRAKDIAQIVSLVAVPLLVAVLGWHFQQAASEREIRRDYLRMALQVLTPAGDAQAGPELLGWATAVINGASPARLTSGAAAEMASIVAGDRARPELPAALAQPCSPVPELQSDSWDALAVAHIHLALAYGECAARHRAVVAAWGEDT